MGVLRASTGVRVLNGTGFPALFSGLFQRMFLSGRAGHWVDRRGIGWIGGAWVDRRVWADRSSQWVEDDRLTDQ